PSSTPLPSPPLFRSVDILDHDVERLGTQRAPHHSPATQRETMAASDARDLHTVHNRARRATRPTARDQMDIMSPPRRGDPAEQLDRKSTRLNSSHGS